MSRIGKKPVELPSGVTAEIKGQTISVKGPKGTRSFTATFTPRAARSMGSMGSRSNCGTCTQSTSPFCRAEEAVALSGMTRHSTRSKCTTLPPAR